MLSSLLRTQLKLANPYTDFPYTDYPIDIGGNNDQELVKEILRRTQPRLVIEVGSWKGSSAISMAETMKELQIDGAVLCVDTWLGGITQVESEVETWSMKPFYKHGYPTLFYQFLANVMHRGVQDYIVPIPNTSAIVARMLRKQSIKANMIYIDGSHEYEDVYDDLRNYWPLRATNCLFWGDDWQIGAPGVITAVTRFSKERELVLNNQYSKWFLRDS